MSHTFKSSTWNLLILGCLSQQTLRLHSIRYLQFIDLVRITSITFKWIELKALVIECIAIAIRVYHNLSPLFTRMRCNSIIDFVVCVFLDIYRTHCTWMHCNIMAYYDKFLLVNKESPCVLSIWWKNMPAWIPQYQNPRFHQRYPEKMLKYTLYPLYLLGLSHFLSQIIQYPDEY